MSSDLDEYTERSLPSLSDEERELRVQLGDNARWVDELKLGLDVEDFERSSVGRYIRDHCIDAINEAFNVFLDANTDQLDSQQVREAHHDARVAKGMLNLLQEAIEKGLEAEKRIEQHHEPH